MRVLQSAVIVLGLLVAGSSVRHSLATMEHHQHAISGAIALPGPVPQCPLRACPAPAPDTK